MTQPSNLIDLVTTARAAQLRDVLAPHLHDKIALRECFFQLIRAGEATKIKAILPLINPRTDNQIALSLAAAAGHANVLKVLLPHCNPLANSMDCFWKALAHGHLSCVTLLLPLVQPHFNATLLSQHAVQEAVAQAPSRTLDVFLNELTREQQLSVIKGLIVTSHLKNEMPTNFEHVARHYGLQTLRQDLHQLSYQISSGYLRNALPYLDILLAHEQKDLLLTHVSSPKPASPLRKM